MSNFNISYTFEAIDQFSNVTKKIKSNLQGLNSQVNKISNNFNKFGKNATRLGKSISLKVGAPLALVGTLAVKTSVSFERAMNQLQISLKATTDGYAKLKKQAVSLGIATEFNATKFTQAQTILAKQGFTANQILTAIPKAAKLARATQIDLSEATLIAARAMATFNIKGKEFSDITDMITKATEVSNVNANDFSIALNKVGLAGKMAGLSLNETGAALATMVANGADARTAGLGFKIALQKMINPGKQVTEQMRKANITFKDAHGRLLPLVNIITQLREKRLTAAGFQFFFGARGASAMQALLSDNVRAFEDLNKQMQTFSGETARAAQLQMKGATGSFAQLKSAVDNLKIAFIDPSTLKSITQITDKFTSLFNRVANMNPIIKKTITVMAAIGIVLGPSLIALGKMAIILKFLGAGAFISTAIASIGGLVAVFTGLGIAVGAAYLGMKAISGLTKLFMHPLAPFTAIKHLFGAKSVSPAGGFITKPPMSKVHSILDINIADKGRNVRGMSARSPGIVNLFSTGNNMLASRA